MAYLLTNPMLPLGSPTARPADILQNIWQSGVTGPLDSNTAEI